VIRKESGLRSMNSRAVGDSLGRKKISLTAAVLALAVIAGAHASSVAERVELWQQRLKNELPIGSPRDAVLEWISKSRLRAQERSVGEFNVRLESFIPHPPLDPADKCSRYQISATLKLNANSRLESADLRTAANCF